MGVRVAGVRKEVKTEGETTPFPSSVRPFVSSADGFWTTTGLGFGEPQASAAPLEAPRSRRKRVHG